VTSKPHFPNPAEDVLDIIEGLCRAISEQEICPRMPYALWAPFAALLIARLRRAARRFASIVARLRAGTLRQRAPTQASDTEPSEARPRDPDPFPRTYGWLSDLVPYLARKYGDVLGLLMRDPGMQALLAEAPQLGRIMRPLLIMTAGDRDLMRPWRHRRRAPRRDAAAVAMPPRSARPPHPLRPPKPVYVVTPDMPHHPARVLARLPDYRPRRSRNMA
jgi:hypothetical protein